MDLNLVKNKMDSAISFFEKELSSIRTSRANASILDNLLVESYGNKTPINQLGNISVPDASMLTIQVWDKNLVKEIENCIIESNLGINPQTDGQIIRLPIPKLSEERRNELSKVASKYSENAKVSIRNIRREILDNLKKDEKEKKISQDDLKKDSSEVQNITDEYILKIDNITSNKQKEILKV
ncbi:MAG: Ribosome-recycling factor [Alphaproteobacteria bacterium MarineAlpha5_Bin8]|nr:MAG: Ribosome-recycling factor [Alphaproteobacteria bacterium MarineAlpha5_Bin7]PPR47502.1 MAG: Ribosome-recycling factor [Alphaproteobacteria bacterium MarineAlpha5_Bin8]PPR53015.1 MAG: Ribosome-recycling factor [Alphaproteobacteria bacterium MarineAlpha5_Bin6]|tara:strand:+ start:2689 stop:3237 length:549 start_codon:yes stop_codon:yes gene_type:complete